MIPYLHELPYGISEKLREVGEAWATSDARPRVSSEIREKWDCLLDAWAASDLPIAIRKSGGVRGQVRTHITGRKLIVSDNSPAQWAFSRAFSGDVYSIEEISKQLQQNEIPFCYAIKKAEKDQITYSCALQPQDNVNKIKWKLCHIKDIGLNTPVPIERVSIELLLTHFILLVKPSNHFLVPLRWAGLGEIPEVIDEVRKFEKSSSEQDFVRALSAMLLMQLSGASRYQTTRRSADL